MEAAFRKVREKPSRLLNSLSRLSQPIMDWASSQMNLQSNDMITPGPLYRSSDLDHLGIHSQIDQGEPAPSGLGGSSDLQHSSHGQIDEDLEQADVYLQNQLARNSVITPHHTPRDMFSPLFSRPSARLANQADFWIGECDQYLNGGEVSLSVVEGLLSEVKSLSRQFESLNPDKVRVEEQAVI